jgi:hypothetical protein
VQRSLTTEEIERFVADGYARIDAAFSETTAAACREILWAATGCKRDDVSTWTRPVVWLGEFAQEPFAHAANSPVLHAAFDDLVGKGRWLPRGSLGTFPVRFPTTADTGDTGWHIDASFPGPDSSPTDYLTWRVNVSSRGRALLMLFLFSDVGEDDAPTRIRVGSHAAIARMLEPAGDEGVRITSLDWGATASCPEVAATGAAGTVYLCHPFLVHAAQVNRGTGPRFVAQPPLHAREPFVLDGKDEYVPVERAIRAALGRG